MKRIKPLIRIIIFIILFLLLCFCVYGQQNNSIIPQELSQEKEIKKFILVVLENQFLACYEYGILKFSYPISSGKIGKPTPTGCFRVISKNRNAYSEIYKAPMPWALSFTDLYAIHAGELPGYPDSHGCIRLSLEDAENLYGWADERTNILIVKTLRILKP